MTGVEYMCSPFARCGVNVQTTARSMLLRYNIVTERETADARLRADGAAKSLTDQRGVGSSGRIRTENQPSKPADPEQLDLVLKPT